VREIEAVAGLKREKAYSDLVQTERKEAKRRQVSGDSGR
jgi:hypothetical protein